MQENGRNIWRAAKFFVILQPEIYLDTVEFEGETYPVVKLEISNTSHPFYTGKSKLVDTAGRVDRFMSRYAKSTKK